MAAPEPAAARALAAHPGPPATNAAIAALPGSSARMVDAARATVDTLERVVVGKSGRTVTAAAPSASDPNKMYAVRVRLEAGGGIEPRCECPYARKGAPAGEAAGARLCKHAVALLVWRAAALGPAPVNPRERAAAAAEARAAAAVAAPVAEAGVADAAASPDAARPAAARAPPAGPEATVMARMAAERARWARGGWSLVPPPPECAVPLPQLPRAAEAARPSVQAAAEHPPPPARKAEPTAAAAAAPEPPPPPPPAEPAPVPPAAPPPVSSFLDDMMKGDDW